MPPDVLWVEQRLNSHILAEAENIKKSGGKVIYDCCDSGSALGYWATPFQIVQMMAMADLVVTDTPERARWIRMALRFAPIRVLENPSDCNPLVDLPKLPGELPPLRICWHGYSGNLRSIACYAKALRMFPDMELVTIGATAEDVQRFLPDLKVERHAWDISTYAQILQSCHLCLLSHEGGWHARMKSAHKMATAIGLGVPVLASATPDYQRMASRLGVPQAIVTGPAMLRQRIDSLRVCQARIAYLQTALPNLRKYYSPEVFRRRLEALLQEVVFMAPRGHQSTGWRRSLRRLYSRILFSPALR